MLSFNECWRIIEGSSQGKNFNLWGKSGVGKTFTIKNLLKEIQVESAYLDLAYPFDLNMLFQVIPISFGIYYQQNWVKIVEQIGSKNRVLVIDNFDRLSQVSDNFNEDLYSLYRLAKSDKLSVILLSRMHLRHFHFSYFHELFQDLELTEQNTWKFGV
jgi:Cdc6-like AAA superfamily ATPase